MIYLPPNIQIKNNISLFIDIGSAKSMPTWLAAVGKFSLFCGNYSVVKPLCGLKFNLKITKMLPAVLGTAIFTVWRHRHLRQVGSRSGRSKSQLPGLLSRFF